MSVPEIVFTPPHAACAHPEFWHSPDGDSTECEVSELVGSLVRALQPALVVETGTAFGYTTHAIGQALRRNGHGRCVSLDVDRDRLEYAAVVLEAAGLLVSCGGPVELMRSSSLDYEPAEPIGFAWFDSLYELRVDEFLRFCALGALAAGTIVGFHDWTSGLRGHYLDVREQIESRLVAAGCVRAVYLPTPRGVVLAEVL